MHGSPARASRVPVARFTPPQPVNIPHTAPPIQRKACAQSTAESFGSLLPWPRLIASATLSPAIPSMPSIASDTLCQLESGRAMASPCTTSHGGVNAHSTIWAWGEADARSSTSDQAQAARWMRRRVNANRLPSRLPES